MKKRTLVIALTGLFCAGMMITSYASGWKYDEKIGRWWYQYEDGYWPAGNWVWLDGNQDGIAECYLFDKEGYLYTDTRTPDGYFVNENGAWTLDQVVQEKHMDHTDLPLSDHGSPLKGIVEPYLTINQYDNTAMWLYRLYNQIPDEEMIRRAVEKQDTRYLFAVSDQDARVLADLSGMVSLSDKYPEDQKLLDAVLEFMNSFEWKHASDLEKARQICLWIQKASYDFDESSVNSHNSYGCLVEKEAMCDGYTSAALLLGYAVDLKVASLGTFGHIWPLFYVDGIWLEHEPTNQSKSLYISDVYKKNPVGELQYIGRFCEKSGYVVPDSLEGQVDARLYPAIRNGKQEFFIDISDT